MTDGQGDKPGTGGRNGPRSGKGQSGDAARAGRLAAALRANLNRRKAQAQARRAGASDNQGAMQDTPEGHETDTKRDSRPADD
jgi:hypothetical protein